MSSRGCWCAWRSNRSIPDYEGDELYAPELLDALARGVVAARTCSFSIRPRSSGRRDLALAPDPRTGFEMTLIRMLAFRPPALAPKRAPRKRRLPATAVDARGSGGAIRPGAAPAAARASAAQDNTGGEWTRLHRAARARGAQHASSHRTVLARPHRAPSCVWRSRRGISRCAPRRRRTSSHRLCRATTASESSWSSRCASTSADDASAGRSACDPAGSRVRASVAREPTRRGGARRSASVRRLHPRKTVRPDEVTGEFDARQFRQHDEAGAGHAGQRCRRRRRRSHTMEVIGESGGGMVKVTMTGRHEVKRVQIEPAVLERGPRDAGGSDRRRVSTMRCTGSRAQRRRRWRA